MTLPGLSMHFLNIFIISNSQIRSQRFLELISDSKKKKKKKERIPSKDLKILEAEKLIAFISNGFDRTARNEGQALTII